MHLPNPNYDKRNSNDENIWVTVQWLYIHINHISHPTIQKTKFNNTHYLIVKDDIAASRTIYLRIKGFEDYAKKELLPALEKLLS